MPPTPKDHTVRARANKASTRAVLQEQYEGEIDPPMLPARYIIRKIKVGQHGWTETEQEVPWQPLTLAMWDDIWASPMAREYTTADEHALFRYAVLVDDFWRSPSADKHTEIRLAQKDFGLTPLDRRRLEWSIETTSKAQADGNKRRAAEMAAAQLAAQAPAMPTEAQDPRLHVV